MHHSICENIKRIKQQIENVQLVVVSKYRSLDELNEVYECGHRDFGENRVQELIEKQESLPNDIRWHAIGHLQRNKVKYIAPFVHLVHSIDSLKLLKTLDKEASKCKRTISFLFQLHIAEEESKFGLSKSELEDILNSDEYIKLKNVECKGLMGMATNTNDTDKVKSEFDSLKQMFEQYNRVRNWDTLSMGMSSDYETAIACGSNMIRVGSKIFS